MIIIVDYEEQYWAKFEEIANGEYDAIQTEISASIGKAEEIIHIYDEEYWYL